MNKSPTPVALLLPHQNGEMPQSPLHLNGNAPKQPVTSMAQNNDDRLLNALQDFSAARSEIRQLREDLKETVQVVTKLANQITRIEAKAEASAIDSKVAAMDARLRALEDEKAARLGGRESGANIWKYATWILMFVIAVAGVILGWMKLQLR